MSVRNYFSGCEGDQHFKQAKAAKARHILMSYMYLRKQSGNLLKSRLAQFPDTRFMVDSGAHTLQVSMDKDPYKNWTMKDFEDYLEAYVKWLVDNRKYYSCAVELDIPSCLNLISGRDEKNDYGYTIVDQWREKMFRPLAKKGIEIIYVWHGGGNGLENWEKICADFSYVGLPGELSSNKDFNKYISVARRYTTRIHGFAATKQADFRDWPWFSVDSITWKTCEIYGTLIVWDENKQKLSVVSDKAKRIFYKRAITALGFNAKSIINDSDYKEVTRFAARSMAAMEEFYKKRYAHRIFYYELRLPPPHLIDKWNSGKLRRTWEKFTPSKNFQQHREGMTDTAIRHALKGISAVQNWDVHTITTQGPPRDFLNTYFPGFLSPNLGDHREFKAELSMLTAPASPPPMTRTREDLATTSLPRQREQESEEDQILALLSEPESLYTLADVQ